MAALDDSNHRRSTDYANAPASATNEEPRIAWNAPPVGRPTKVSAGASRQARGARTPGTLSAALRLLADHHESSVIDTDCEEERAYSDAAAQVRALLIEGAAPAALAAGTDAWIAALVEGVRGALPSADAVATSVVRQLAATPPRPVLGVATGGSNVARGDSATSAAAAAGDRPLAPSSSVVTPKSSELRRYLKQKDYAALRSVSVSTVKTWCRLGLPTNGVRGRGIRIKLAEAEAWLEAGGLELAVREAGARHARTRRSS
jgi:hypothetical protein